MQVLQQPRQLFRLKRVIELVGYQKSTIYQKIQAGEFPAPIPIGARAVAWNSESIFQWIDSKIDAAGRGK